eukprot:6311124-Prymnesium_polylepis.2
MCLVARVGSGQCSPGCGGRSTRLVAGGLRVHRRRTAESERGTLNRVSRAVRWDRQQMGGSRAVRSSHRIECRSVAVGRCGAVRPVRGVVNSAVRSILYAVRAAR